VRDELDADGGGFLEESGDAWPDEPDEFDPNSLGPEIPSAPDPTSDDVDVPPELAKAFWAAVIFANVGLLGVSLGPMLIFFEGRVDAGLASFLIGVLGLVFAYRRYHGYMNRDDDEGEDDRDGEEGRDRNDAHATDGSGGTTDVTAPTDADHDPDRRETGGGD
jgi:hypothetical protein